MQNSLTVKELVKKIGFLIAPHFTLELLSYRSQRLIMRIERETGCTEASQAFCARNGAVVQAGPFKGMRYPKPTQISRNLIPKLIGSYEDELSDWIEEAVARGYKQIVNIGAADGYYTVGLALRCPDSIVIGFDSDRWARNATRLLANENHVTNVDIHSVCTLQWLGKNVSQDTLLLLDCEGCEVDLLDAVNAPSLLSCDIMVELHAEQVPGISEILTKRFNETHEIRCAVARLKTPDHYTALQGVPKNMLSSVISEGRHGPQQWFYMTRRR